VRSLGWKGEFFSFLSFGVQAANQVSVASTVPVPVAGVANKARSQRTSGIHLLLIEQVCCRRRSTLVTANAANLAGSFGEQAVFKSWGTESVATTF